MGHTAPGAEAAALSSSERALILTAARLFYLENLSKMEIADRLDVSRFKVARLLEVGVSLGLVTITLHDTGMVDDELSRRLAEHLGLSGTVVVQTHGDSDDIRHQVGAAAGELLESTLREGEVLGMTWGRTLSAMIETMPNLPLLSVVQLTGAAGNNVYQSPVELVRKVAQSSGGSAHPIFSPMVIGSPEIATALRGQRSIAEAINMFADVTTAVLSVGAWDPADSQLFESVHPDERTDLVRRGVIAEVAAVLVDAEGDEVAPDFEQSCIAITSEQLRNVPRRLAVAAGISKARAVSAVAQSRLITELVTDRALALAILDEAAGT